MTRHKRTRLFYFLFRIFMSILLATSIVGIFVNVDDDSISRNVFVAVQSIALLLLSFGPSFAEKKIKVEVPDFMENIFLVFIICALLFGEIAEFFVHIPWWDDLLHTTSGLLVTIVGFSIINATVRNPNNKISISPLFTALFVFCFSMTVEIVWEIFEYTADSVISSSNMLRTRDSITLVPFEGLVAVKDTFHDILLTFISAFAISTLGYIDNKKNLGIFNKWIIKPKGDL